MSESTSFFSELSKITDKMQASANVIPTLVIKHLSIIPSSDGNTNKLHIFIPVFVSV